MHLPFRKVPTPPHPTHPLALTHVCLQELFAELIKGSLATYLNVSWKVGSPREERANGKGEYEWLAVRPGAPGVLTLAGYKREGRSWQHSYPPPPPRLTPPHPRHCVPLHRRLSPGQTGQCSCLPRPMCRCWARVTEVLGMLLGCRSGCSQVAKVDRGSAAAVCKDAAGVLSYARSAVPGDELMARLSQHWDLQHPQSSSICLLQLYAPGAAAYLPILLLCLAHHAP